MKPGIRAITFDVGGTLIEPQPSVGEIYAQVAREHGWDPVDANLLNERFAEVWRTKREFSFSRDGWSEIVWRTFHGAGGPVGEVQFFEELYDRFARADVWRIFDDVLPVIDQLLARGIPLAVISNWDERLRPLMKELELERYFEFMAISCEIGFQKPSSVIFGEAARKLGCPPASILHVGDSRREDLEGAHAAGFQCALLCRGKQPGERFEIGSLAELSRPNSTVKLQLRPTHHTDHTKPE